jgi:aminomethyltransferase
MTIDQGSPIPQFKPRRIPVNLRQSGGGNDPRIMIHPYLRKGPYFHLSARHGCWCYSAHSYMYRPRAYVPLEKGGLLKEYEYLTEAVTLWDVATERQIQIKGPDAVAFADLLATRDLTKKFSVGQARFALLCYEDGNILNDPIIFRIAEDEVWFSTHTEVVPWARGVLYKSRYDVSINEIDVSPVQIQGPKSRLLMEKLVRQGLLGKEVLNLKYYQICRTKLNDLDVAISRTGFSSEFGYEIYLYDSIIHADRMWETIWSAGQEFGLQVIAPSHIRSLEAGMLWYGIDIDPETNPFEAGLDNVVDLDKPDFIGKEALLEIKEKGVSQKIVGLKMGGKPQLWYNPDFWLVKDATGQKDVGYVTRAFYSPKLGTNIAHAMVLIEHATIGTALTVAKPEEDGLVPATIVKRPFYDPEKKTPLGQPAVALEKT